MKRIALFALVIGLSFGCKTKLESGGAYSPTNEVPIVSDGITNLVQIAPDPGFFITDATFDLTYSTIDAAFKFEFDNRAWLFKISPQIKRQLDRIRPKASAAKNSYARARESYLTNPTPAGLSALNTALSQVKSAATAAQNALPK